MAATWSRDSLDWHVAFDLSSGQLQAADAQQRAAGRRVVDVAGYLQQVDGALQNRYCAVWVWKRPDDPATRLFTGVSIYGFEKDTEQIDRQGFTELESSQAFENADGQQELCGVCSNDSFWFHKEYDRSAQEYAQLDLLNMTQVNVDVSSAPLQTIPERLSQDLANATARLEVYTDDSEALETRARAHFWLHDYERAISDLTSLLEAERQSPRRVSWLMLRARAQARLGKAAEAQSDLQEGQRLGPDPLDWITAQTLVSAASGDIAESLERWDTQLVRHAGDSAYLHHAAMFYALVSELARPQDTEQAERCVERALELLAQAFESGLEAYLAVAYEPAFAPIRDRERFQELLAPGLLELRYAAIWRSSSTHVALEAHDLEPPAHLEACRRFAADDYRPLAVSVAHLPRAGKTLAASVWIQPRVTDAQSDAHARRTANAALALLHLGAPQAVWSTLKHAQDPSMRSHVIDRCRAVGVDPELLVEQLERDDRVPVRIALVQCLSQYDSLPPALFDRAADRLQSLMDDPADAGLRAAISHAFRRWGCDERLRGHSQPRTWQQAVEGSSWFHTSLGQEMIVLRGPATFLMGSARAGPKTGALASQHHRTIPRSFAIGAQEVTVEQFHEFLQDFPEYEHFYDKAYSPEKDCPQGSITWYDAAAFCRWLSERENVPEDQMCYPPIPQIRNGMIVPADSAERTGYRLPTEAEWEYACRAQSSVKRPFGISDQLLGRYAWYEANASNRTQPVGTLLPNDFGFYDMLGNVREWTHDPYERFYFKKKPHAVGDRRTRSFEVANNVPLIVRGGSCDSEPRALESSTRDADLASSRGGGNGFRLARTVAVE